ncbi:hypothetical protein Taro_010852 [Colocasia esculenta]|uniref:Uncharacterized protein n=1 Tax=Colocasia esculenta TaxID=4460 RepID=A0A843U871_COLES|nr:hypothetical protein [Colocasia esculenta]
MVRAVATRPQNAAYRAVAFTGFEFAGAGARVRTVSVVLLVVNSVRNGQKSIVWPIEYQEEMRVIDEIDDSTE